MTTVSPIDVPESTPEQGSRPPADARRLLLEFVRERDVECPRCGYNLRNLTQPICPECQGELTIKVGAKALRVHMLIITVAPGIFCALGLAIFTIMCLIHGWPGLPFEGVLTLLFMFFSGLLAIGLAINSRRFLKQSNPAQAVWAWVLWLIHISVFVVLAANS